MSNRFLSERLVTEISYESHVAVRTVRNYFAGKPVRHATQVLIEQALKKLGKTDMVRSEAA